MTDQSAIDIGLPGLAPDALDLLMPIHLLFGPDGRILRCGPTLAKLLGDAQILRRPVHEIVSLRGTPASGTVDTLMSSGGRKLILSLSSMPDLPMRGICVPLTGGAGGLLKIALGASFAEVLERRSLTLSDFSPCDQTVDLLYLREAIDAVAAESERQTDRLVASRRIAMTRASTDELTGLANRRALALFLDQLTSQNDIKFAVMQIDLDHFKEINDTYGHHAGDAVLRRVGEILNKLVRSDDMAARAGGDEFVLVLRGSEDPVTLDQVAQRIFREMKVPVAVDGVEITIKASIGTTRSSFYPQPQADQMLRDADEALYASKRFGRGRNCFFKPQGLDDQKLL